MDDTKQAEAVEMTTEESAKKREEMQKTLAAKIEEMKAKSKEANEAMTQGKGRLRLEKPIKSGDEEISELAYDFTELTGMEYANAMDSDPNAQQIYHITYRQGLALFAKAASKQTERIDTETIVASLGVTDAVEGVQLATLFYSASTRAGRMRISKR